MRLWLLVTAVASVALAVSSFRVLSAASTTASRAVPVGDLRGVTAFLAPVRDSGSLVVGTNGSMVGQPDPFGAPALVNPASMGKSLPSTASGRGASQPWIVSSILFEQSKRSAIVNDAWVTVGDPVGSGARVAAIERKYIVVTDVRGSRQVVPLQGAHHED